MELIAIDDPSVIDRSVEVLRAGGVVMHPTETCYGLAVDVFNEQALKKLYRVKGMSLDKPVSVMVDGIGMAKEYGIFSDKAFELSKGFWPGALSILVPRKRFLPDFLNRGSNFVSIRYSSDSYCQDLVEAFGSPVTTTSANITTEPQLYSVDPSNEFLKRVDLVVDGGEISKNQPSTIVKVDGDNLEVLRQGSVVVE